MTNWYDDEDDPFECRECGRLFPVRSLQDACERAHKINRDWE